MADQNFRVRTGLEVGSSEIQESSGDALAAGNVIPAGQARLSDVSNVKILGGSYGFYAVTSGDGNLGFAPISPAANAVQTFTFTGNVNGNFGNSQVANIYLGSDFSAISGGPGTATWTWSTTGQSITSGSYNFDWTITNTSANPAGLTGSGSVFVGSSADLVNAIFAAIAAGASTVFSSGSAPVGATIDRGTLTLAAGVTYTGQPQLTITKTSGSATWNRAPSSSLATTWSSGASMIPTYQFSIPSYPGYAGNANVWVQPANGANAQTAVADFYTAFSQASNGVFTLANNPGGIANSFSINFNSNNSSFTMGLTQTDTGPGNAFVINTPPGSTINTINYSLVQANTPVLFDTVTFADPLTGQTAVTRLYPGNTLTQAVSKVAANTALAFTAYSVTGSFSDITFVRSTSGQLANVDFPQVTITPAAGGNGTLSVSNAIISYGQGGTVGVSQILAGTNITVDPPGGTGVVTINSTGGGGLAIIPVGIWRSTDVNTQLDTTDRLMTNTFTGSTTANSDPTEGATLEDLGLAYQGSGSNWYFRNIAGSSITLKVDAAHYTYGGGTRSRNFWFTVGAANTQPTTGTNQWLGRSGYLNNGETWGVSRDTIELGPWQTFGIWGSADATGVTFGGDREWQQTKLIISRLG